MANLTLRALFDHFSASQAVKLTVRGEASDSLGSAPRGVVSANTLPEATILALDMHYTVAHIETEIVQHPKYGWSLIPCIEITLEVR